MHGQCSHESKDCRAIKYLKNLEYKIYSSLRNINEEKDEETENEKKKFNFSYLYFNKQKIENFKNPFLLKCKIFNRIVPLLIDTGADRSILNIKFIPKSLKLKPPIVILRGENGCIIDTVGEIDGIEMTINNHKYEFIHLFKKIIWNTE